MALSKHPHIYKAIREAIDSFGEHHHITGRQHFAPLLGFTGSNGHIQLGTYLNYTNYNPSSPHPLSVDHLAILLDELGEERNIVLDAIVKEFDFLLVPKTISPAKISDINLLVDMANIENSDVFRVVKSAMVDGEISSEESANILKEIEEAQRANAILKDRILHLAKKDTQE